MSHGTRDIKYYNTLNVMTVYMCKKVLTNSNAECNQSHIHIRMELQTYPDTATNTLERFNTNTLNHTSANFLLTYENISVYIISIT